MPAGPGTCRSTNLTTRRKLDHHWSPGLFWSPNDPASRSRSCARSKAKSGTATPSAQLYVVEVHVDYTDAFGKRYRGGYAGRHAQAKHRTPTSIRPELSARNNLVFVTQEGYNYDICWTMPAGPCYL